MKFSDLNHPLGLRHLPLAYASFTKLAYESFASEKTLVFLDTNILGLPYRFHNEARKGFFSLLRIALSQKRLYIPAWAANEYFHNAFKSLANGNHGFARSAEFIAKLPKREKVLGLLGKVASEEDLDKVAKQMGIKKEDVLNTIAELAQKWNSSVEKIGADLDPETIHGELTQTFLDCFLPLDYNKHNTLIDQHAERRRANRIPPGLTDLSKGDIEKRGSNAGNIDGDLALWLEILDNAQKISIQTTQADDPLQKYECVMILTEEKKEDFSYAPRFRNLDSGAKKTGKMPNITPKILLTDPRLVSEFESRIGHRNIAFVNVETLAHGWQGVNGGIVGGDDIRAFARALMEQMDTEMANEVEDSSEQLVTQIEANIATDGAMDVSISTAPVPQTKDTNILDIPEGAANDEKNYVDSIAALPGVEMINSLNTHNWYVQNPAVVELLQHGVPLDNGVAFLLGRSLFQAAHGNAWRADTYIKKIDETITGNADNEQALLAGMAYEALFDGDGARRHEPKNRNLHHVLELLCKENWKKAREWILMQMQKSLTDFYWKPGDPIPQLKVILDGQDKGSSFLAQKISLQSPGYKDVELLAQKTNGIDGECLSINELIEWISQTTLVPANSIHVIPKGITKIEIPSGFMLDPLRIYRARRAS